MQVLVGLGNPGSEYARTRHNVGFRLLDALAARHGLIFGPAVDACQAAIGRIGSIGSIGSTGADDVALVKPLLYMNRSGEALMRWARGRDLELSADGSPDAGPPLVVCDDIALPLGTLRLRGKGGTGGHRGLESLTRVLGGELFPRARLGVAGGDEPIPPEAWSDYVLGEFTSDEWSRSEEMIDHACEALVYLLSEGYEAAASRYNRKPPSSAPE